jgi:hypothetical protein
VSLTSTVLHRALLIVAAGALVAGCSAGSGTSSSAPNRAASTKGAVAGGGTAGSGDAAKKLDPCSMLTTDQVTSALGQPAAPGKPEPNFDTPECEWDPAAPDVNGNVTLDIGPWVGDPGVKPLKLGTAVPGVGDEAYDSGNTGLFVRKGSQGFRIWVFNVKTQSSRLDLEKQLAAVLLAEV